MYTSHAYVKPVDTTAKPIQKALYTDTPASGLDKEGLKAPKINTVYAMAYFNAFTKWGHLSLVS